MTSIPVKPMELLTSQPMNQSGNQSMNNNSDIHDNDPSYKSNNRCTVSFVANIAFTKRQIDAKDVLEPQLDADNGFIALRENAGKKDGNKESKELEIAKEKKRIDYNNRVVSLPSLCDAIRSKCLNSNKSCMKTSDFIDALSRELLLKNINRKELNERTQLLAKIAPEFISIIPADKKVPYSTMRVNLKTPVDSIKKKLARFVNDFNNVK